jgi:hypothetical protein
MSGSNCGPKSAASSTTGASIATTASTPARSTDRRPAWSASRGSTTTATACGSQ